MVAQENWREACVADRVGVLVGPAAVTLKSLVADCGDPYDLVFIGADKQRDPVYLQAALTRPGSLIVVDNVIRGGRVVEDTTTLT